MRALIFTVLVFFGGNSIAQCTKDTECKFDRICNKGACITPTHSPPSPKKAGALAPKSEVWSKDMSDAMSKTLQDQLSCVRKPEPAQTLRELRARGVIGNTPVTSVDGMNIFAVKKPISVFGFKVLQVTGWEDIDDKTLFWRGPGTGTSLNIQAIVEGNVQTVKREVEKIAGKTPHISEGGYTTYRTAASEIGCFF